jgi:murein L,D-transpeptidase YafK
MPEIGCFSEVRPHHRIIIQQSKSKSAVDAAKKLWLKKEVQHHFARKDNINLELYDFHLSLTKGLNDCEHTRRLTFLSKIEKVSALNIQKKRNTLVRKLSKLHAKSSKKPNYTSANTSNPTKSCTT